MCEDADEARGLRTVLERAGCRVVPTRTAQGVVLHADGEDAARARQITTRISKHFARDVEKRRSTRMDAARRRTQRALWTVAGLVALGLLVVGL